MKRKSILFVLLCVVVLSVSFAACSETDPASTPAVTAEESESIVEVDASLRGEFRDALESLTFRVEGIELTLPMSFAALIEAGVEMDDDLYEWYAVESLAPGETRPGWLILGERTLTAGFTNFDGVSRPLTESYITFVQMSIFGNEEAKLYFPGDIAIGSSYDAVITAYGEPRERDAFDEWVLLLYETADASVRIWINTETNLIESLDMIYLGNSILALYEVKNVEAASILFVGNSFTRDGDIPGQLQTLAGASGIEIIYRGILRGGAILNDAKDEAIEEMQTRRFDYLVLQDQSARPLRDFNGFLNDIRNLNEAAREHGVTLVLFSPAVTDDEARQSALTEAYKQAAEEVGAILVNAGEAWFAAYQTIPGLSPSKSGNQSFFAASIFAATLFELHITEIPQENRYRGDDALPLAQAAWDFVRSQ